MRKQKQDSFKKAIPIMIMTMLLVSLLIPTNIVEASSSSIALNKKTATIYVGKSVNLKVKGTNKKVTWTSNKKSVASVNKSGKVTGKKKGTAKITAKIGSKKLTCKVTVKNPYLNKTKLSLESGKTYTLKLKGSNVKKWSSSNNSIATVSSKGKVTAKKDGKATITCLAKNNKKYKCTVTVKKAHTHKYNIVDKKEATCTIDGYVEYKCECGDTYKETVKATGHTYNNETIVKQPTCLEKGIKQGTCTKCGETVRDEIDLIEHTYDDGRIDKEVTCEQDGIKIYTCRVCLHEKKEIIEALKHNHVYISTKAVTCTQDGYDLYRCSKCNNEKKVVTKSTGHSYTKTWISSTSTSSGYYKYTCSVCGDSYNDYSESRDPNILDNWQYTLYESEGIINIDSYKYSNRTPSSIYLPGEFEINGKIYKTTIGYGDNAESRYMFSDTNRESIEMIRLNGVTLEGTVFKLFYNMSNLRSVYITNVKCADGVDLTEMFSKCSSLKSVDISDMELSKVESFYGMFSKCTNLETVKFPTAVNTRSDNVGNMFSGCTKLKKLDNINNFILTNVVCAGGMFQDCESLTQSNYSFIRGSDIKTTINMFSNCKSLTTVELKYITYNTNALSGKGTTKPRIAMEEMFRDCTSLQKVYINEALNKQLEGCNVDNSRVFINTNNATFIVK